MVAIRPTRASALNTSHPLAGRLIHGYVFSEGAGTTRNLIQTTASATLQPTASWVTNSGNSYVRTNPGGIEAGVTTVIPQAPFHIVVGYRDPTNSAEPQQAIVSNQLDGGNTYTQAASPFYWFYDGTGSWNIDGNAYYANAATGSVSSWPESPAAVYAAGAHHLHLAVTTTNSTLYHNGVSLGTSSKVVPGTTPQAIYLGVGRFENYQNFRADWDYVYIFQGTLTQTEIDDLRADPYALVLPLSRFYLPSTGTTTVNPAFDSAWDDTSSVVTRPATTTRGASAFVEVTDTEISASNTWDVCLGRYISEPLAAQTISGTVMGIIRARESNAALNARSQMVIRVVSGDGATVRGTLLAQNNTTTNINEWVATTTVTAARNARFPVGSGPAALTPVTAQQGDRIVIEVGGRAVNTVTTSYTLGLRFGENAADLANNETGTTEGAPWIEFSNAIQFFTAPSAHNVVGTVSAAKPTIAATATQTFPARALSGTIAAKKPTLAATSTQTFPARAVTGTIAAAKPTVSSTAVQVFPARSITAAITATKPTITASSNQAVSGSPFSSEFTFEFEGNSLPPFSITGTIAAKKPTIAATATQTSIASALTGAIAAPKPSIAATATQTFPARAVVGAIAATKPALSAAAVQVFPARAVVGTVAAKKPTISATAVSTRLVSGTLVAPKPSVTATTTQTFPERSVTGSVAAKKPTVTATAVQVFPASALVAALSAPKPTLTAISTVSASSNSSFSPGFNSGFGFSSPVRNLAAALIAPKPSLSATSVQVFPARSLTATLAAPKPAITSVAVQTFPARSLTAVISAKKPNLAATAAQVFPPRNVAGAITATKPVIAGSAVQVFPSRSITAALAAPKPAAAGTATQTFPARSLAAALLAPKPNIDAQMFQSQIGSISISSSLDAPKPTISATAAQVFPARNVSGTLAAKKPMLSASAVHPLPPHEATANLAAPKPTAAGSLTQSFPERLILGTLAAPKPTAAGGIIQVFPERFVSAALAAPKPTIRGTVMRGVSQEAPELSNAVYMTGSVNPDVRLQGIFDLDVPFTAAIESEVFLTGTIDQ